MPRNAVPHGSSVYFQWRLGMPCALRPSRANDGCVSARVTQLCGSSIEAPHRRRSRFHPAARALSACDETFGGAEFFRRVDQPIAQTLVVPFVVIEFHELVDRIPQGAFPEEDHAIQAALLDGTHKWSCLGEVKLAGVA